MLNVMSQSPGNEDMDFGGFQNYFNYVNYTPFVGH
jgi:hypothetical protein